MKINSLLLVIGGGVVLSACSTHVENVASEQFEPIFEEIALTADNTAKTGGIFQPSKMGCSPLTNVPARLVIF